MKKNLLLFILSFVAFVPLTNAQNNDSWEAFSFSNVSAVNKSAQRDNFPTDFKLFQLKSSSDLENKLKQITSTNAIETTATISVPNAAGQIERFVVYESSNFTPELQAMYPQIRAFVGKGLDDKNAQINLSFDPSGIQVMIFRSDKANEFIESYAASDKVYAVFESSRQKGGLPWTCSTEDKNIMQDIVVDRGLNNRASNASYKTMRLALSCTAEYSNYFGATSSAQSGLVLAGFNATLSRVNPIFERDLALKLLLIAQTTNVIYYNPATDPYTAVTGGNAPGSWNVELQNNLSANLTGPSTSLAANNAAYDIGHLFGASGGGGNAGCIGCVCVNDTPLNTDRNKGAAYTSPRNGIPVGDTFDIDYVAHEIGHQIGGNHTFSHSFENNAVNVEPGSGSSIMAYAGITGPTDVQSNSDDYFTYASILQIQNNLAPKTCPVSVAVTHGTPLVNAGINRVIPKGTPFALTPLSVTDTGGGTFTYCWEQYDDQINMIFPADPNTPTAQETTDAQNLSYPSATKVDGANFRSFKPVSSPTRYFPSLQTLNSGIPATWEVLSDVARPSNFTLTVRDNVANGGQTGTDDVRVTTDDTRGPLLVTSQNAAGVVYPTASTQTVTWAVNGTNTSAGGTNVDILLSTDGGLTYPNILLTATPNDGTQAVTLPAGVSGAFCRFMVRANGNIFFNINQKAFAVGDYTYQTVNTCTDYPLNFGGLAIPEDAGFFTEYQLVISDVFNVTDANIKVELTHGDIGSLIMGLRPPVFPAGSGVQQFYNRGRTVAGGPFCTTADMNVLFDEQAAAFTCATSNLNVSTKPNTLSTVFPTPLITNIVNSPSNGIWRFYITDIVVGGAVGTMQRVVFNLCKSELTPVLSTENFEFEDFSLYPNPNKGDFTIKFKSNSTNDIKINVYDMSGRSILDKSYTNTTNFNQDIALDNVQAGIYLVSIIDGAKKTVKRIVIQ